MAKTAPLWYQSMAEISPRLKRGELSPVTLAEALLDRIAKLDSRLVSFVRVTGDLALEQARTAEREIRAGNWRGPLHGIPIGIKDLVHMRGLPTTCASPMLQDYSPGYDATIVEKLRAAGAVILGKLNLTEFALYGYHPALPHPHNPWHLDYAAGVSSSGSGVAVAAGLCVGAIGTDTGGSIRFPSSMCGIVGLKPTFGKISRYGVFPLAETLDHIGPMTRRVADCAMMLQVLEGRDPRDPTTRSDPAIDYLAEIDHGAAGLRIGIDRTYCATDTDPEMMQAAFHACDTFRNLGLEVVDVDVGGVLDAGAYWMDLCAVDALLRHREFYPQRADEYGPVFRSLLDYGVTVSAEAYARGQLARQAATALLDEVFSRIDCLLCPATSTPAVPQRDFPPDRVVPPEAIGPLTRYTGPYNMTGHPSITLPNGRNAAGLPLAMQLIGRHGEEATILRAAAVYEAATDWHTQHPNL